MRHIGPEIYGGSSSLRSGWRDNFAELGKYKTGECRAAKGSRPASGSIPQIRATSWWMGRIEWIRIGRSPLSTLFPEEKGWTWGAVQGVFAQNPDRIFVVMRGELPDLASAKKAYVELETAFGLKAHVEVPGRGMYGRNASVGQYASPGEASDDYLGVDGKDYRWKHIITVYDSKGDVKEAWSQWDSLFKPDNPNVLSQGRVHKILISPYDPEKRVWAIDDGHEVIRIFSNDGKKLLQTIGTLNTTTERNAKMTGNTARPSYIQKTGPPSETFGRQTDIAWLPDGTFFVTDGYEETRVVKFDKNGKFLMAWGERGAGGRARDASELFQYRARHRDR